MSFTAIISANIKDFESKLKQAQDEIDAFEKKIGVSVKAVGKAVEGVGKKMSILSAALVAAGGKAFTMAADFQDAIGATDQIFKDASDTVNNWAKNLSSDFGIAKEEALKYSNLMGSMLINIGNLTEQQAAKQSAKLIELAGDLTAMYGGTTQDAVRALTGALKGNNTMLDNYGMAVNDALVKQKAFELGLSSGTGELSLQAKQAATLALIWEQTGAAQGQAGREANSASGAMRALSVEVKNLSTEIGEVLLPIITPIVAKIRDFVSGLRELSPEMLRIGVVIAGVVAALGPLLVLLGKILQMLPLIKASIAALTGPIGIVSAAVVVMAVNFHKNIDAIRTDWDFLTEHLKTTSAAFGDVISGNFSGWWDKVRTTFDKNTDYIQKKWQQFKEYFTGKKDNGIDQAGLDAALAANEMTGMAGAIEIPVKLTADQLEIERLKEKIRLLNEQLANSKAEAVDTTNAFEKLVAGMTASEAIQATSSAIENLQSRIVKLQTGILPTSNLTGDLTEANKQLSELTAGLDLLTGGREINIDVKMNTDGIAATGIDTASFIDKIKQLGKDAQASLTEGFEGMLVTTIDYGQMLSSGLADVAGSIGDALGSGNFKDLGKGLIESMGSLAQQFGSLLVGMGIAALHLQTTLITKPWLAIAAGAALVALGAAASAAASKMVNNATSGGGGAASYQTTTPAYGPSEYRGAYRDEWAGNVTFKRGNNELVGVLEQANKRNNRIG